MWDWGTAARLGHSHHDRRFDTPGATQETRNKTYDGQTGPASHPVPG